MRVIKYDLEAEGFAIGHVDGESRLVRTFQMTLKLDVRTFEEIQEIQRMINECEGKEATMSIEKKDE